MGKLEVASARGGECGTVGLTVATDNTLDVTINWMMEMTQTFQFLVSSTA
jgi:hypothetical protein